MTDSSFPAETWRNRPGRDLLIALLICYAAVVIYTLMLKFSFAVFGNVFLTMMMVPVGLFMTIMQTNLMSFVCILLLVALGLVFVFRMPWFARIPLLVALFAGMVYGAASSGITLG